MGGWPEFSTGSEAGGLPQRSAEGVAERQRLQVALEAQEAAAQQDQERAKETAREVGRLQRQALEAAEASARAQWQQQAQTRWVTLQRGLWAGQLAVERRQGQQPGVALPMGTLAVLWCPY